MQEQPPKKPILLRSLNPYVGLEPDANGRKIVYVVERSAANTLFQIAYEQGTSQVVSALLFKRFMEALEKANIKTAADKDAFLEFLINFNITLPNEQRTIEQPVNQSPITGVESSTVPSSAISRSLSETHARNDRDGTKGVRAGHTTKKNVKPNVSSVTSRGVGTTKQKSSGEKK